MKNFDNRDLEQAIYLLSRDYITTLTSTELAAAIYKKRMENGTDEKEDRFKNLVAKIYDDGEDDI